MLKRLIELRRLIRLCKSASDSIQCLCGIPTDHRVGICCSSHSQAGVPTDVWSYVANSSSEVHPEVENLFSGISEGRRAALAKGITLVESLNPEKKALGQALLAKVLRHMKLREKNEQKFTFRIGLSGAPGAGKSTLIEVIGTMLADEGHKVAVLAVDPSSVSSGGSILGDKTRMFELSRHPNAYIRPSPNKGTLGGVTRSTNEAIGLCEGAGYDIVLVETVGVGQSEIAVSNMVDMFCVIVPPASGDELQGMKKGIIEVADAVIINKCDGDLMPAARRAASEYTSALKLMRKRNKLWTPQVKKVSAKTKEGIPELWEFLQSYHKIMVDSHQLEAKRDRQKLVWMWDHIQDQLVYLFQNHPKVKYQISDLERQVEKGQLSPGFAADVLLNDFFNNYK